MIDVEHEDTLRLADARQIAWLKGRGGQRLSLDSLRRWSSSGLQGVVLETVRIGGTTYTSRQAILRFLQRLNGGAGHDGPPQIPNTTQKPDRTGM